MSCNTHTGHSRKPDSMKTGWAGILAWSSAASHLRLFPHLQSRTPSCVNQDGGTEKHLKCHWRWAKVLATCSCHVQSRCYRFENRIQTAEVAYTIWKLKNATFRTKPHKSKKHPMQTSGSAPRPWQICWLMKLTTGLMSNWLGDERGATLVSLSSCSFTSDRLLILVVQNLGASSGWRASSSLKVSKKPSVGYATTLDWLLELLPVQ